MATAFFLWSATAPASTDTRPLEGCDPLFTTMPETTPLPQALGPEPAPKPPKPRRSGKKKPSSSKKQPQRGLGVAQLEKLRIQERWKKMTEGDQIQTPGAALVDVSDANCSFPPNGYGNRHSLQFHFPAYDYCGGGVAWSSSFPAAAPAMGMGYAVPWAESYFLQRHRMRAPGLTTADGTHAPLWSTFQVRHYGSVAEIGGEEMRFPFKSPVIPELSSNQMLQCSDNCDLCLKKQLLQLGGGKKPQYMETKLRTSDETTKDGYWQETTGEGYYGGGLENKRVEVKEYEFFPSCTDCGSKVEEDSSFRGRACRDSSSSATNPSCVDLSLKLSY